LQNGSSHPARGELLQFVGGRKVLTWEGCLKERQEGRRPSRAEGIME
jgi:hypothetical protein